MIADGDAGGLAGQQALFLLGSGPDASMLFGMTKLGIIADTHEQTERIAKAVSLFQTNGFLHIYHLGDIVSPPTLEFFRPLSLSIVFGNNDGERGGLQRRAALFGWPEILDERHEVIDGRKVSFYHGTSDARIGKICEEVAPEVLFVGHTHKLRDEQLLHTRVINPGALFLCDPTIAFFDLSTGALEVVKV